MESDKQKNSDYKPYIEILEQLNLVDVERTLSEGFEIIAKFSITKQFLDEGGFKQKYLNQQKASDYKSEFEKASLDNLRKNNKLVELQLKSFWWIFGIAVIGGICGIISLILDLER